MKNYVQEGDVLTVTAPAAVLSGAGVLVGSIFGVASADSASGAEVEIQLEGVFDLAKAASQAWTVGALIYWDNATKVCTTTASGNKLIGTAVLAVDNAAGSVIGRVRLNGCFTS